MINREKYSRRLKKLKKNEQRKLINFDVITIHIYSISLKFKIIHILYNNFLEKTNEKNCISQGSFPCKKDGFLTLGHEFAGTVDAVGSSVKNFKVGQRVAVDPNSGCNTCNYCHDGSYQHCSAGGINSTIGIYKDGGFSTHAIVPESQVRFYQFYRSNDIVNFVNFFFFHF